MLTEVCTTISVPVLTNRQFKECMFTYMQYISCVGQMSQKIQGIWCFDAVIFFATFLVFFNQSSGVIQSNLIQYM